MQRVRFLVVLFAVVVAVPALIGDFLWDDKPLIVSNHDIGAPVAQVLQQSFFNQSEAADTPAYYRPVPKLALSLTYRAAGLQPWAFHLVNIVLHGLCVWLAFNWLARRFGSSGALDARVASAAGIGTLLFAWHPSRPQAVTWISGCTELWPALFLLVAAALWDKRAQHIKWSIATAFACALAYLSKESAIVFPFLLVIDAWLSAEKPDDKRACLRAVPYFVVATGIAHAVRIAIISTPWSSIFERGVVALAMRMLFSLGHATRATLWPWNPRFQLNFSLASIEHLDQETRAMFMLGSAVVLGLFVLALLAFAKPSVRPWLSDTCWFVLPLLPALNVVPIGVGTTIGERFLYVPMLGCAALVARGTLVLQRNRPAWLMPLLCAPLLFAFARTNLAETRFMLDDLSLFEHFYEQDPTELFTIDELVNLRLRSGDTQGAYSLSCARASLITRVSKGGLDVEQVSRNHMNALMTFARLSTLLTSDVEQVKLLELREFYDAAMDPSSKVATLALCGERARLVMTSAARAAASVAKPGADARIERILVHARTLDLTTALALAKDLAQREPHDPRAREMMVRALMWQERWGEARAAVVEGRIAVPNAAWDRLSDQIERAGSAALAFQAGSTNAVLAHARSFAELGLPAQGYAILKTLPPAQQESPDGVQMLAELYVADKRFDLAEVALLEAAKSDAVHEPFWMSRLAMLQQVRESSPLRRISLAHIQ